ncbi:uncharacterized protein FOMMEDRAFT_147198 [Fomitiporia mediterranea MF3/22]|uniref:uncharacterized protein n=1 Tax=Fomitiporia mediterranea (strain MF3/22) TaxID=694068 RepID=UPI0004408720|nr:uncharacterized protein FOMMEDRAFT_147198 [Fomitiporia mediterranea MF3/22]EJD02091.1 hypothetical protein FOMMEDRAFT_147198 [Fomitiporia mediterranea MF3/22]
MHFTTAVVSVLALPAFVVAQYGAPPAGNSNPTTTSAVSSAPSAPPNTPGFMNVDVGPGEQLVYNPANFSAPNGTIVTFYFPNDGLYTHTVTQSSFNDPCTPLAANSTAGTPAGFDSSFQAGVQFSINITNDQIPIWFHCKLPMHCGLGMVGAINAPTNGSNTYAAFQAKAMAIGQSEPVESTGPIVLGGFAASAAASPSNTASAGGSGSPSGATRLSVTSAATALLGAAAAMILFA